MYNGTYGIGQIDILRALSTDPQISLYRTGFKGGFLWCFSERTCIPTRELDTVNLNIRNHEGVPLEFKNTWGEPCLLILADVLNDAYSSGLVYDLFTKGSEHRNNSVILITQNIFHQSNRFGDISLNAKYLILLKNVRDRSQFSPLAQQLYPKLSVDLYDSNLHATAKPHGFLVLDLSQDIIDLLQFRTEIFPEESPFQLIYASVDYETDTIDLSHPTLS